MESAPTPRAALTLVSSLVVVSLAIVKVIRLVVLVVRLVAEVGVGVAG
jgi:hypothetical protein